MKVIILSFSAFWPRYELYDDRSVFRYVVNSYAVDLSLSVVEFYIMLAYWPSYSAKYSS